jgi:hypothetical protein
MNDGIVTDGHAIFDSNTCFLISAMDDHSILDVDLVADADAVDITPHDRVEPDAAFIADLDIPDHGGIRCDKTIFSKARGFAFDR